MDLNKQHGFIESNEDRSRAMYYNRGINMNESRHHRQYFIPERTIGNNKACGCSSMPGNIMCNECRTNTATEDGGWGSQHISRSDIRNIDTKGAIKQNPLYMNSSGNNNAYWQQNCTTAVPQMDRNILVKPSTTDTNYSYKQQYQQSDGIPNHQRANAISTYCKERSYNEYSPKSEVKISYMPSATTAASIYNIDNHNNNVGGVLRSGKTDQQVINPSNILSTKEQHPSPNYARKCPQIFSPAEQNSTHMSLYMPTPQFSSDKFINAHNQKMRMESPQHEYRTLNNTTVQKHILPEKTKLSQSPVRLSSPMTGYTNASKNKYPSNELMQPVQSNIMQQQTPYRSNNGQSRNIDYFPQNNTKVHAPEMSPIIAKQSPHAPYQYSNCSVPPPPPTSHILPLRGTTNELDYVKKEDDLCDSLGVPNRNLYINPYNTPPSSDSCYKESSSPFLPVSHYREESPHSYNKYSKTTQEIDVGNKLINVNQNTPPLSRTPSFRNQQYYYETSSKYDGSPYGTPSPAVATVASPSSILSTQQTQIHHNEYASPSHRMQSYQSAAIENRRHSNKAQDNVPSHIDTYDLQIPQKSKINCPTANNIQAIPNQTSGIVQTAQQPKKSHVPKPNYKELINQAYARRNIPEEELNLQIIQKTLNFDTQVIRTNVNNVPRAGAQVDRVQQNSPHLANVVNSQPNIAPAQDTYRNETYRQDLLPHHPQSQSRTPVGPVIPDIRPPVIKQEEKLSNYSPLDLSMRTVKTKADSTEYKYKCFSANSPSVDCKYGLPRVDFTPNFSMHASDRNVIIKPNGHSRMEQNECATYTSPELSHIPHITVPRGEQIPLPKKQYNESSSLAFNNATQYKGNPRSTVIPNEPASTSKANLQRKTNSLVIKSTTNAVVSCDVNICQVRPSVLETNPFATVKNIKSEPKISERNMLAVDKLPPDTSIMPLPKTVVTGPPPNPGIHSMDKKVEQSQTATQSNYHRACELNRNYLGRKRHLHEYSNSNPNYAEPIIKQPRYSEPQPKFENMRSADISVIAVNEKSLEMERIKAAEKSIQAEVTNYSLPPNHIDIPIVNEKIVVFKEEPVTPTSDVAPIPITPPVPIKTETNFAARIRTKAELKGFTFNPPIENTESIPPIIPVLPAVVIKEEPSVPVSSIELPSITGLTEDFSTGSLLDFSWDNTCNNFVKQLLTNKKKPLKKKFINTVKEEISEDDLPVSTIVNKKLAIAPADVQREKDDSLDFLLAENNISNMESATTTNSILKMDTNESNKTSKSALHDAISTQSANAKKIGKLERGKMRQEQEKRFAARLPDETSSESDNELDKRKTDRLKKPLKKAKIRNLNTATEKNRFSDCGSDSTTESDDKIPLSKSIKKSEITDKTESVNIDTKIDELKKTTSKNSPEKKELKKGQKETLMECNSSSNKTVQVKKSVNLTKATDKTKISTKESMKTENKLNISKNVEDDTTTTTDKNREEKTNKKNTLQSKVGLNTMTRSKRKRELEMQLANSKVLRNDKIIRNSTTKIKRKYVKKYSSNQKDAMNRESSEILSTRLRSRVEKSGNKLKNNAVTNNIEKGKNKNETRKMSIAKKKEHEEDEILAAYRYKRSLKVPPSLITIKHPQNHKIAASLPDLETHYDDFKSMSNTKSNDNETDLKRETHSEEPRSIIDLLHSRVINKAAVASKMKAKTTKQTSNNGSVKNKNENSQNTESTPLGELLPAIKKEDDESNDGKKRHFSIFETKVLQTKTRTESKLQQRKEIIREIFVGDDRPASAPPEMIQSSDGNGKMTYEQTYEQFLQQMNIIINNEKLQKFGRASDTITAASTTTFQVPHIKQEDDTESASALDADEKYDCENQQDGMSTHSGMQNNFKRRRPTKYLRRKGSSGFDYIRKKKKPNPIGTTTQPQVQTVIKSEEIESEIKIEVKTEDDVYREIQKWVLNKGVGQSTMHKAARQGYIDVIVYCLDRMGMNPDQKDNAGYTPLHEACTNGWLEIARILLQYGANHSAAAHSGIRPLHEASENEHDEIVRLLLSYGADPLLATYSGQTPLMLASSTTVRDLLNSHLSDVQNIGPDKKPWKFNGPWETFDSTQYGYDVFAGAPNFTCDMSRALRKSSASSVIANKKQINQYGETSSKTVMDECAVVLDNIDRFNTVGLQNNTKTKPEFLVENSNSEAEIFEFEEADVLLPPLYLLKDEGTDKWVLLSDLCNLLKVKSKDTLLKQIYPSSSVPSAHKNLMRELKMSDFLEKATCLQLLCAGEKINICASKVVLIKYNESVRNLLGVKTILTKF